MSNANLFEQQRLNRRKSIVVVTVFLLFFAWIGFGGDLAFYLITAERDPEQGHHTIPWIGIGITILAFAIASYARRTGPKKVLWATGARELVTPKGQEEQMLVNVVEEMAIAFGLPRPKIWIVPDKDPNAFATGNDEATSHVAVTEGLLDTLNRDELQGVIAHEMAHIKNHDAHLCIADPLGRRLTHKQGFIADMLATHPPMALRVARLKAMAFQYEKTGVLPESL